MSDQVVTIVWPAPGGRSGMVRLPWVRGKQVKHYTLHPELRRYGVGALVRKCRIYNSQQKRVRNIYAPQAGETIVFIQAPRR